MTDWKPKFKNYPHFDAPIPPAEVMNIVQDEVGVAKNKFFPFLFYDQTIPKYGKKNSEIKPRRIRYASRRDSYIFSYYRHKLSQHYETRLREENLHDTVSAYRKIPVSSDKEEGKCNIHFAKEAFEEIIRRGDCYAVALDISSYFEKISHDNLEKIWCDIMGFSELPQDHKCVFKNITEYSEVEFDEVCKVLGFKGAVTINGVEKFGFKMPKENFFKDAQYKQLCSPSQFREKIVNSNMINRNTNSFGIPQGSPISDVLANMYLLYFDKNLKEFSGNNDIFYRRYSDDILVVMPKNKKLIKETIEKIQNEIRDAGKELEIKDSKTIMKEFTGHNSILECSPLNIEEIGSKNHNGNCFEYLGFSFDGQNVRLKDGTMHRLNRKMVYAARREAALLAARYHGKTPAKIMELLNFSVLYQKFGKVKDFEKLDLSQMRDKKKLTFLTYAKKADRIMKESGLNSKILGQMKHHKKQLKKLCYEEIIKQNSKRSNKSSA